MGKPYTVELHLAGGTTISAKIGDDALPRLTARYGRLIVPDGLSDHEVLGRLIITLIHDRLLAESGIFEMPDEQGGHWHIRGSAIIAARIEGFEGDQRELRLGFERRPPD